MLGCRAASRNLNLTKEALRKISCYNSYEFMRVYHPCRLPSSFRIFLVTIFEIFHWYLRNLRLFAVSATMKWNSWQGKMEVISKITPDASIIYCSEGHVFCWCVKFTDALLALFNIVWSSFFTEIHPKKLDTFFPTSQNWYNKGVNILHFSPLCSGNCICISAGTNVEDSNAHSNVAKFGGDTRDSNLIISHVTLFTTK